MEDELVKGPPREACTERGASLAIEARTLSRCPTHCSTALSSALQSRRCTARRQIAGTCRCEQKRVSRSSSQHARGVAFAPGQKATRNVRTGRWSMHLSEKKKKKKHEIKYDNPPEAVRVLRSSCTRTRRASHRSETNKRRAGIVTGITAGDLEQTKIYCSKAIH